MNLSLALLCLCLPTALAACGEAGVEQQAEPASPPTPEELAALARARRPAPRAAEHPLAASPTLPPPPPPAAIDTADRDLYTRNCAPCHGAEGRGDGPFAPALAPPPRDFGALAIKFAANARGMPSDEDLARIIARGLPGSGMPAASHLERTDVSRLSHVVRRLAFEARVHDLLAGDDELEPAEASEVAADLVAAGPRVELPPRPDTAPEYPPHRLFAIYCGECHGNDGTATGAFETEFFDDAGWPLRPRNLTWEPLKGGGTREDVMTRIVRGIPGTPMPATTVRPEHLWALSDYALSLREGAPGPVAPGATVTAARGLTVEAAAATTVALSPLRGDGRDAPAADVRLAFTERGFVVDVAVTPHSPSSRIGAAVRLAPGSAPPFAWSPEHGGALWRSGETGSAEGVAALPRLRPDAVVTTAPARADGTRRTVRIAADLPGDRPAWIAVAVWDVDEETGNVRESLSGWHAITVDP